MIYSVGLCMLRRDEISGRWHIKDFSFTVRWRMRVCSDTKIRSLRRFCYLSRLVGTCGEVREKRKCKRARDGESEPCSLKPLCPR